MTKFCPLCDVSLDLHDGPGSCLTAEQKASLLDSVFRIGPNEMFGGK